MKLITEDVGDSLTLTLISHVALEGHFMPPSLSFLVCEIKDLRPTLQGDVCKTPDTGRCP